MSRITGFILGLSAVLLSPAGSSAQVSHASPPKVFQGVYLTNWSAGSRARIDHVIALAREKRINSVVIDIKDATGYVAYDSTVPDVARYDARRVTIRKLGSLLEQLHREGLYAIARIVIFQDPRLALARSDLAVHQRADPASAETTPAEAVLWRDRKGQTWVDPASREVWDYNLAIAREALDRGFDEINVDYVRFPSDGSLQSMEFPVWDGAAPRRGVIRKFFAWLRQQMPDAVLSADLFGLATINHDDLGIGQVIEDAYPYFDYVCPMVYPSHYANGFLGFPKPSEHPYKVVNYSLESARQRLQATKGARAKLRPWLQDFNLGAIYTREMVEAQIKAAQDATGKDYAGYTLWAPSNNYTRDALAPLDAQRPAATVLPASTRAPVSAPGSVSPSGLSLRR